MEGVRVAPVRLPPIFDLQAENAATEWKFWYTDLQDYLISTKQHESADKVKLSLLRNIMGQSSARKLASMPLTQAQRDSLDETIKAIEKEIAPRDTVVYDRYVFSARHQREGRVLNTS